MGETTNIEKQNLERLRFDATQAVQVICGEFEIALKERDDLAAENRRLRVILQDILDYEGDFSDGWAGPLRAAAEAALTPDAGEKEEEDANS